MFTKFVVCLIAVSGFCFAEDATVKTPETPAAPVAVEAPAQPTTPVVVPVEATPTVPPTATDSEVAK